MPWLPLLHQLKNVCDVTTVTQQCKQSQIIVEQGWKSCTKFTNLNLRHFKMVEARGLKIIASRSPWMVSPPYQISWKSTNWFRSCWGGGDRQTHRQDGDLISLFPFLENRLKIQICKQNERIKLKETNIRWTLMIFILQQIAKQFCMILYFCDMHRIHPLYNLEINTKDTLKTITYFLT
jgi:hypothetical protein